MTFKANSCFDFDHVDQDSLKLYLMALNSKLDRFPNRWDSPSDVDYQIKSRQHLSILFKTYQFSRASSSFFKSLSSFIRRSSNFKI